MTRIEAGDTPDVTRRRNRSAITAVLPVPAPATTRTGPVPRAAAWDCSRPSVTSRGSLWRRPADTHPEHPHLAAQVRTAESSHGGFGVDPELVGQRGARGGEQDRCRAQRDLGP